MCVGSNGAGSFWQSYVSELGTSNTYMWCQQFDAASGQYTNTEQCTCTTTVAQGNKANDTHTHNINTNTKQHCRTDGNIETAGFDYVCFMCAPLLCLWSR